MSLPLAKPEVSAHVVRHLWQLGQPQVLAQVCEQNLHSSWVRDPLRILRQHKTAGCSAEFLYKARPTQVPFMIWDTLFPHQGHLWVLLVCRSIAIPAWHPFPVALNTLRHTLSHVPSRPRRLGSQLPWIELPRLRLRYRAGATRGPEETLAMRTWCGSFPRSEAYAPQCRDFFSTHWSTMLWANPWLMSDTRFLHYLYQQRTLRNK